MSASSDQRAREFLAIADQFKLGHLVTESSHPATAHLSETAQRSVPEALRELFEVDRDVLDAYSEFVRSGRASSIADAWYDAVKAGGKVFFTGCGSTGRLSIQLNSIWRDAWRRLRARGLRNDPMAALWENRTFSVMAGGDFALIKAVEGFEDFTQFGRRQIADLGVGKGDVVFSITEGGETSFVIGTAWEGLDQGAKVYFVYNNPDAILCEHVQRSREVIQEPRIEKINLTTGPMAISGSTRMQATTIQLCVLLTVMEMVVRRLLADLDMDAALGLPPDEVPSVFLDALEQAHATLSGEELRGQLAALVELEERTYRSGHKNNYFANALGIDLLTDTTERSPTFCTPPFRRFDDREAAESWAFLYVPFPDSPRAWRHILKRDPICVDWPDEVVRGLVGEEKAQRTIEIVRRIGVSDLMKFRIGTDGLTDRPLGDGDLAVALVGPGELSRAWAADGEVRRRLSDAKQNGAKAAAILVGPDEELDFAQLDAEMEQGLEACVALRVPTTNLILDGVTRATVKMMLNALSTCTMVRLGRVMGNTMVWVVPSNLKLIDRATRYIVRLTGLEYVPACHLLHEVIEYVQPRMLADQAYPPVVGMSVLRARHGIGNEEAERRLAEGSH